MGVEQQSEGGEGVAAVQLGMQTAQGQLHPLFAACLGLPLTSLNVIRSCRDTLSAHDGGRAAPAATAAAASAAARGCGTSQGSGREAGVLALHTCESNKTNGREMQGASMAPGGSGVQASTVWHGMLSSQTRAGAS